MGHRARLPLRYASAEGGLVLARHSAGLRLCRPIDRPLLQGWRAREDEALRTAKEDRSYCFVSRANHESLAGCFCCVRVGALFFMVSCSGVDDTQDFAWRAPRSPPKSVIRFD